MTVNPAFSFYINSSTDFSFLYFNSFSDFLSKKERENQNHTNRMVNLEILQNVTSLPSFDTISDIRSSGKKIHYTNDHNDFPFLVWNNIHCTAIFTYLEKVLTSC